MESINQSEHTTFRKKFLGKKDVALLLNQDEGDIAFWRLLGRHGVKHFRILGMFKYRYEDIINLAKDKPEWLINYGASQIPITY